MIHSRAARVASLAAMLSFTFLIPARAQMNAGELRLHGTAPSGLAVKAATVTLRSERINATKLSRQARRAALWRNGSRLARACSLPACAAALGGRAAFNTIRAAVRVSMRPKKVPGP